MVKEIFADSVFIHANVVTIDKENTVAQAVGIKDGKILFVGTDEEAKTYIGKDTKVIDAAGRTVMPGFIDSHIHFIMYGLLGHGMINVDYTQVDSIEDIKRLVREDASKKKPGEWIILSGYDHNKLVERRHPTMEDLDEAAPNNPVQCIRCCAHMAVYNSKALEIAGITSFEGYASGEVVVDETGKLTGLLKETAHMSLSKLVVFPQEDLKKGLMNAQRIMVENGITTVHDAGSYGRPIMNLMQQMCFDGSLKVRIQPMIFDMFGKESGKEWIEEYLKTGIFTGLGNEHFRIGPVKIMTDGSTSGPSCSTREPYSHDANLKGLQVWEQEEMDEMIDKVHQAGFQMTGHAVGDQAVTYMVNSYEKALQKTPKRNHRHRIEHCAITYPELIERICQLGIVPVSNPAFISINASDYNRFYGKRVDYMFPLKTYLEKGITTAIGSDAPVTNPNPMFGIFGAVNRRDIKTNEECGSCQKIDMMDILRMYTYNGAYAGFEEKIKGSLEEGKLADVVMLSENILEADRDKIMDICVEMTMIDGEIVYEKGFRCPQSK